jgi:hypothetical protein
MPQVKVYSLHQYRVGWSPIKGWFGTKTAAVNFGTKRWKVRGQLWFVWGELIHDQGKLAYGTPAYIKETKK